MTSSQSILTKTAPTDSPLSPNHSGMPVTENKNDFAKTISEKIPFDSLPKEIKTYIAAYKVYLSTKDKENGKPESELDGRREEYWNNLSSEEQTNLLTEYSKEIAGYYDSFPKNAIHLIEGLLSNEETPFDAKNFSIDNKKIPNQYYCALFPNRPPAIALCDHVIKGEYDQVKNMLKKAKSDPTLLKSLLTTKVRIKSYSFVEINNKKYYVEVEGTALQMALGADDVNRAELDKDNKPVKDAKGNIQILHSNEGMAELIMGSFKEAFNNDDDKGTGRNKQTSS